MSCLSIVLVYIVLCSEKYTTTPETWVKNRWTSLNDRRTKTPQNRSVGLCKPVLDSMNCSPLLMGNLVLSLSWSCLEAQPRPRERNDFARASDWYFDVDQSRSSEQVKKSYGLGLRLVGRRHGLVSPRRHFRPPKNRQKTLNSVTVHL